MRNRQACFALAKELVQVQPGVLTGQLAQLVPGTLATFKDKAATAAVRIEVLQFLRHLFRTHPADAVQVHLPELLPPLLAATSDRYSKTAIEALQATAELIRSVHNGGRHTVRVIELRDQVPVSRRDALCKHSQLRSVQPEPVAAAAPATTFLAQVQRTLVERLKAHDVDQEVKEAAIVCEGAHMHKKDGRR